VETPALRSPEGPATNGKDRTGIRLAPSPLEHALGSLAASAKGLEGVPVQPSTPAFPPPREPIEAVPDLEP
jgi:hypothetical protein